MGLILGIIIFACTHLWILKKIDEMDFFEYDVTFCRDVRAQLGMITYASEVETWRKDLNRRNSKF